MSTDLPTDGTGDARPHTPLQRILMIAFKTGLVLFLAAGILLVLVQATGLVAGDEGLTVRTIPGLQTTMTYAAAATGLVGFVMAYVFRWEAGGDD